MEFGHDMSQTAMDWEAIGRLVRQRTLELASAQCVALGVPGTTRSSTERADTRVLNVRIAHGPSGLSDGDVPETLDGQWMERIGSQRARRSEH